MVQFSLLWTQMEHRTMIYIPNWKAGRDEENETPKNYLQMRRSRGNVVLILLKFIFKKLNIRLSFCLKGGAKKYWNYHLQKMPSPLEHHWISFMVHFEAFLMFFKAQNIQILCAYSNVTNLIDRLQKSCRKSGRICSLCCISYDVQWLERRDRQ